MGAQGKRDALLSQVHGLSGTRHTRLQSPTRPFEEDATEILSAPVVLYENDRHTVYWLGIYEPTAFRCNSYLVRSGDTGVLIDPGGRPGFPAVRAALEAVMPIEALTGMVLCHQDPDVAASMCDWLALNPALTVFTTPRTHVLLSAYGSSDYQLHDVEAEPVFVFPTGHRLHFIGAPFLHFPGAFTTFDAASGFLFSGDIWAAPAFDWRL